MAVQVPKIDKRTYNQIVAQVEALVETLTTAVPPTVEMLTGCILAQDLQDALGTIPAGTLLDAELAQRISRIPGLERVQVKGWHHSDSEKVDVSVEALTGRVLAEDIIETANGSERPGIIPAGAILDAELIRRICQIEDLEQVKVINHPPHRPRDAGGALIRIFGRFMELVVDRLNRVPEKNYLAFLNLIGADLLPPQPARVPLTFELAANSPVDALVPAGTQVAAPPAEGEEEEVIFETDQELVVTRAQLKEVFVRNFDVELDQDLYSRVTPQALGTVDEPFDAFAGDQQVEHALYLAHDDFFTLPAPKTVTLTIHSPEARRLAGLPITWSYWDGTGWQPLSSTPANDSQWTVTIENMPAPIPRTLNGLEASWLQARLDTPLPSTKICQQDLTPTEARSGQRTLDLSRPFYPFDSAASQQQYFYLYLEPLLASIPNDLWKVGGTAVTLDLSLAEPGVASSDLVLVWEYFKGPNSWQEVGQSGPGQTSVGTGTSGFSDETQALTQVGIVSFQIPTDRPEETLHGLGGRWLRVKIASGSYETRPQIESVRVGYEWVLPQIEKITAQVEVERSGLAPDLAFANSLPLDLSKDFYPFGEQPRFNDTFYLASAEVFSKPGAQVTVNLELSDPPPVPVNPSCDLEIAWEAWDGQAWKPVKAFHSTKLAQDASQGSTTLTVESTEGFAVGDCICIDPGGAELECNRIKALDESKREFTLANPLSSNHKEGTCVLLVRACTKLDAAASKDSETLTVESTEGFAKGNCIRINPGGANQEDNRITEISNKTFTLETQLDKQHTTGESIIKLLSPAAFTCNGQVTFTLPLELGPCTVNGQTSYWIRARLNAGNYGTGASTTQDADAKGQPKYDENGHPIYKFIPASFGPPSVKSLSLDYTYKPRGSLSGCQTCNDFIYADRTAEAAEGSPFEPFTPTTETRPALYLGFDTQFDNRPVSLYVQVEPPSPDEVTPTPDEVTPTPDEVTPTRPAAMTITTRPQVAWEYANPDDGWTPLGALDETQGFAGRGLIHFIGPRDFARRQLFGRELYWVRARSERGEGGEGGEGGTANATPRLRRLLLNTTWASQATTVQNETLGSSNGNPSQTFQLAQSPVLPGACLEVREPEMPSPEEAAEIKKLEGPDAITTILDAAGHPEEIWVRWHAVPDFHGSGPRDRHYTIDYLTGTVRFGDGRYGLIPPPGQNNIRAARYRSGGGAGGNHPRETVIQLKSSVPYIDRVTNFEEASGGADRPPLDRVKRYGPRQLRHRGRAVTVEDFEDLAYAASADVARAKAIATSRDDGTKGGVIGLIVVPQSDSPRPIPSLGLLEQVKAYLQARCPATAELWVAGPVWVEVTVTTDVVPASLAVADQVEIQIKAALERFLHPLTGGPLSKGWPFGRLPHDSDLYALVESVEGVDHVRTLTVDPTSVKRQLPFLIYSGQHQITLVME